MPTRTAPLVPVAPADTTGRTRARAAVRAAFRAAAAARRAAADRDDRCVHCGRDATPTRHAGADGPDRDRAHTPFVPGRSRLVARGENAVGTVGGRASSDNTRRQPIIDPAWADIMPPITVD